MLTKFQFHCSITCRDILYFVFWLPYCHTLQRHQYLIYIMRKSWISLEWEEIWQKVKCHSSSLLKAFQISLFFNTSIFHFIGTLKKIQSPKNPEGEDSSWHITWRANVPNSTFSTLPFATSSLRIHVKFLNDKGKRERHDAVSCTIDKCPVDNFWSSFSFNLLVAN